MGAPNLVPDALWFSRDPGMPRYLDEIPGGAELSVSDPNAFACLVWRDSMSPRYREGDAVVFSPAEPVVSGDDALIIYRAGPDRVVERLKRVEFLPGGRVRLVPANPAYRPGAVARRQVVAMFKAVAMLRAGALSAR